MNQTRRVEVFLRASVPFDARARQAVILGRVQALQARGLIDEFVVDTWADNVTDAPAETALVLATLDGFERWAVSNHADLSPGFESRECHSGFTGQRFRKTTFPVACLAVYDDDELTAVYPHSTASGCVTIADGLASLEVDPRTDPDRSDASDPKQPSA